MAQDNAPALPGLTTVVDEVRRFLRGLQDDLPDLFKPAPPPQPTLFEMPEAAAPPVKRIEREKAREILTARAEFWSAKIGVKYNQIRIKDQSSLWGSCSVNRNLNFNWRLVMAPPEVLDYVVIHELCHLLEMNHSPRFWRHVADWCPNYKDHRRWLRKESQQLRKGKLKLVADDGLEDELFARGGQTEADAGVEL